MLNLTWQAVLVSGGLALFVAILAILLVILIIKMIDEEMNPYN